MDIRDYVRTLRQRWRLITLLTVAAVAAAAALTYAMTPTYQASAQMFVSTAGTAEGTISGLQQGGQFAQQRVKSYADIVDSPQVTRPVARELGLDISNRALEEKIQASAPLDTVLINVQVTDESPELAQALANAVAERFTEVASELETPDGGSASLVKVSVVRAADLPEVPVSPRVELNLALGLLVGLAAGVALAVVREMFDVSLKGVAAVQEALGLPLLGVISHDPDILKRPLIVRADPRSPRAEAFRQLRTNLRFVDIGRQPRSIVVTSSLPEEGKSTTTCNLAIALDEAGLRVIVVEADLRRPRLGEYFGLEDSAGLTDALVSRTPLEDLLQPWGGGSLRVLLSGPTPPNPSELLGSQQMLDLLRQLETQADLVLIDAPPLLPVTDAAVLARQASGAMLILRSGRTTADQARRSVDILNGVDAHLYGVVVNMAPTKGLEAYKYGYYGRYAGPRRAAPGRFAGRRAAARQAATPRPPSAAQPAASATGEMSTSPGAGGASSSAS